MNENEDFRLLAKISSFSFVLFFSVLYFILEIKNDSNAKEKKNQKKNEPFNLQFRFIVA